MSEQIVEPTEGIVTLMPANYMGLAKTSPEIAEPLQEALDNIVKAAATKPNWPLIAKYCKALGFPPAHLPKALGLPGDDVNQWKGSHEEALDKCEAYARKNYQHVGPKWQEVKLV